jgi:hypothetical protein
MVEDSKSGESRKKLKAESVECRLKKMGELRFI